MESLEINGKLVTVKSLCQGINEISKDYSLACNIISISYLAVKLQAHDLSFSTIKDSMQFGIKHPQYVTLTQHNKAMHLNDQIIIQISGSTWIPCTEDIARTVKSD